MTDVASPCTHWRGSFIALLIFSCSLSAASLPDPLTLEYALSLAQAPHPLLDVARAGVEQARAEQGLADAREDLSVTFEGRARWVQPPPAFSDLSHDDSKASLVVRKNLYDFGRTAAQERTAQERLSAAQSNYQDALSRRRVLIMERFFTVLLADKEFNRLDENMAVLYVTLDRLRQRHALGQISDLNLLAAESEYQTARRQRAAAAAQQQSARAALAQALNHSGELPTNLSTPRLPQLKHPLPEVGALVDAALAHNPSLVALRAQIEAARARLDAAKAENRPRLNGEVEASAYARPLATNDQWRAGVTLEVPLYTGGTLSSLAEQREAELAEVQSRLQQAEMELRQTVLDLSLRWQTLQVQREEAATQHKYRELYLERSRTIYEQEMTADLGDAMVRLTEAELAILRADFDTVLTWERINAVTGGMMEEVRK